MVDQHMNDFKNSIALNRKISDWGWYKDANTFRVFLHLLISANWKDSEFMGVKLSRGQTLISQEKIAEKLDLTRDKVRNSLKKLKSTQEITQIKSGKFVIITVVNYDKYQPDPQIKPHVNPTLTPDDPHVIPTSNKENKNNKENNVIEREDTLAGAKDLFGDVVTHKDRNKFSIPDWIPIDMWNAWLEMRVRQKKPATDEAKKRAVRDLIKFRDMGNDPGAVIEQSVYNGWAGLFKLKEDHHGNGSRNGSNQPQQNRYKQAHNAYAAKLAAQAARET